jgi:benzodiazapine receptor
VNIKEGVIMKISHIAKLIIAIVVPQFAGFIGSLATEPAIESWYASITKPSFTPPNGVFAPVWITLFFLMGLAAFIVWSRGWEKKAVRRALTLFMIQLVLNVLWSILFFGLHSPLAALLEILLLWVMIMLTMIAFFKISRAAGLLFLPYILWVSFAAVLNFAIFRVNP